MLKGTLKGKRVRARIEVDRTIYTIYGKVMNLAHKESCLMLTEVTSGIGDSDQKDHPDCFIPWIHIRGIANIVPSEE